LLKLSAKTKLGDFCHFFYGGHRRRRRIILRSEKHIFLKADVLRTNLQLFNGGYREVFYMVVVELKYGATLGSAG
jgi:hypothetical protein